VIEGMTQRRLAVHPLVREHLARASQLGNDQVGIGGDVFDQQEAKRFR
jgi:hypothetical protein